ncbi:hypothetical protein BSLG_006918 [Batrachochytrium salamandrivorans]|nr:hypothetical protein BASA81_006037 [Batrachochytrium salamandrivorans]KAJ1336815.1 hypothetical protein BSLG_006918 [Batrachochytrium salamandrivorans]
MRSSIIISILALAISYASAYPVYSDDDASTIVDHSTNSPPKEPEDQPEKVPRPNPNAPKKITLLHTNDLHAHFDESNSGGADCSAESKAENKCYGGIARIKTLVDSYRSKSSNVVLLDAGDQFQGTLFFSMFGSNSSTEFMNKLKYDAMEIGNHEFDRGEDYLASFLKSLNFPAISSNIDLETAPKLKEAGVKPYMYLPKYSLAIIGFITNTTADITMGGKNVKFYDPVDPVQKYVDELRSYGVKRIIGLSHNGYKTDMRVAANTYGVDLIVGGHSHSLLLNDASIKGVEGRYPTNVTNKEGKTTWVVQAHRYGDYLGHLELEWDEEDNMLPPTGDPILMDQSIEQDPAFQKRVDELRTSFMNLTAQVLATSTGDFSTTDCITGECAIGNLMVDCMVSSRDSSSPAIGLINSGGLRASLLKGSISYGDVMTVLPFENQIASFNYTGAQIKEVLENTVSMYNAQTKKLVISVPQWSGLKFTFDSTLPVGSRVTTVTVDNKPLSSDSTYTIITSDFVASGGDNILSPTPSISGDVLADVFAKCIKKLGTLTPATDNRFSKIRDGKH